MSAINQLILLAEYNQLMNQRQFDAAATLSQEDLIKDAGAFFKSVLGTLNHIMVGDIVWLARFAKHPSSSEELSYFLQLELPNSLNGLLFKDFDALNAERIKMDNIIIRWIRALKNTDINSCIQYTDMMGKEFNKPLVSLINHLFLHQVHHRGQVTTLLSQFGVGFGETDIVEIIEECSS